MLQAGSRRQFGVPAGPAARPGPAISPNAAAAVSTRVGKDRLVSSRVNASVTPDLQGDPLRRRRRRRRPPARAHRRARPTTSPWSWAPAGCRPPTRSATPSAELAVTDLPGFPPPAVAGPRGRIRSCRDRRQARAGLPRPHPLYEGRGVAAVVHGVRTAVAAGCKTIVLTNGCGGLRPGMRARPAGADQRPHQPDGRLADRRRALRRPHRPLLAAAARAVPGGRPDPGGGRLRAVPRPALRDPGRDQHGPRRSAATWSACPPRWRRSPPARRARRCSASPWSPTSPPA